MNLVFEMAAHIALQEAKSDARIYGFWFHLGQAVLRFVGSCGLKHRYISDPSFRHRIKCLSALSFVRHESVPQAFEVLQERFQPDESEILEYFRNT